MLQDSKQPYLLHLGFSDMKQHVVMLAGLHSITETEACMEMLHNSGHLDLDTQNLADSHLAGYDVTLIMSSADEVTAWMTSNHSPI